jgi:hypothetical protein
MNDQPKDKVDKQPKKPKMTPEEVLEKAEQRQVKAALAVQKAREALRKKENRRKYELGGLIVKAGLKDESNELILGVLMYGFFSLKKNREECEKQFKKIGIEKIKNDEQKKV